MILSYLVGGRDSEHAIAFMDDLRGRLANRVQLTSDGHRAYLEVVQMSNVGSMFHIYFQSGPVRSSFDIDEKPLEMARQAFLMHTLNLGVLISGGNRFYLPSGEIR